MKSFGKYISKYLLSFIAVILLLLLLNGLAFIWTFYNVISSDYGEISPMNMLEEVAMASSIDSISLEMSEKLRSNKIWAMFLNQDGNCLWSVDLPSELPTSFTIQDVALFSKGYLDDYPVFVWNSDDGLLILGYPKDSYMKITSNYYSVDMIKIMPIFLTGILCIDFLLLFLVFYFSKRKIIKSTAPIIAALETLSDGKPITLSVNGELSEMADSVNKASQILSRQNEARANWISGVSHDIRTPLSMIMGYARRIADDKTVNTSIKEQAEIVGKQSIKIKELVQDLNLVSQLEYEMQPLNKQEVRISKLLRTYVAELLNSGLPDAYSLALEITPEAETVIMKCDERLISRAISNLVQNSINHNPQGCQINLFLDYSASTFTLIVEDDGIGLSTQKIIDLGKRPHYMESTDERLDLRHGLGLLIVRQIAEAYRGKMRIESKEHYGFKTTLNFSCADRKL